jgi:hypothetical protein
VAENLDRRRPERGVLRWRRACLGSSQQAFQETEQQHTEWPTSWNDELFTFLRDNPEP